MAKVKGINDLILKFTCIKVKHRCKFVVDIELLTNQLGSIGRSQTLESQVLEEA